MDKNLKNIKELIENNIVYQRRTNILKERNRLEIYFNIGREIVLAVGVKSEYGESLLKNILLYLLIFMVKDMIIQI